MLYTYVMQFVLAHSHACIYITLFVVSWNLSSYFCEQLQVIWNGSIMTAKVKENLWERLLRNWRTKLLFSGIRLKIKLLKFKAFRINPEKSQNIPKIPENPKQLEKILKMPKNPTKSQFFWSVNALLKFLKMGQGFIQN